ncbi:MAG TPA: choice-of-anchor Q domain-containing protein [Longimicrobiaceae bacterium]|nr:choice-of-anchor Q domain-containing protein [Longimicrobiaceae bacterium]
MKRVLRSISWTWLCACLLLAAGPLSATTYYVNSRAGDDASAGTAMETAWKSLANLERHRFLPGDSILFAKGSQYTGGFVFRSSGTAERPIYFGSYALPADSVMRIDRKELEPYLVRYGAGPAPSFTNPDWDVLNGNVFHIAGSYIVIDGLYFHDNARPPFSSTRVKNVQKAGAVYLALGTHHNVVRNCEFFHSPVGIKVKGTHDLITRNYLHDATEPLARTWGPIAIMIVSPYNEVSYNRVENYGSYGGRSASDGGVVELDGVDDAFDGRNVNIHHNISINNQGFLELAGRHVDSVTVAYNLSDDFDQFIGGGSMKNVFVYNNTVIRTREPNVDRYVFWTFAVDSTFMTVRNNIFVVSKDMHVLGPVTKQVGHHRVPVGDQVHDHNLYYSVGNPSPIGVPAGDGDLVADPLFVDAAHRNFRLSRNSPARDRGVDLGYATDLDGYPISGSPDVGAYEF